MLLKTNIDYAIIGFVSKKQSKILVVIDVNKLY